MKLYRHFTANGIKLEPFPFTRELAMEAYIVENESVLELDDIFLNVEVIQHEVTLSNGRNGRDGRIDILASYDDDALAIIELKKEELATLHLAQLEDYLKQRNAIFGEHPKLLEGREHLKDTRNWIGILVGTHIAPDLAGLLENGHQIDGVPVAALVMQRYRSDDGNVFVATEKYFKNLRRKDQTQYQFDGATYGKGRLVLAVVRNYVSRHPNVSLASLRSAFPSKKIGGHNVFSERSSINADWKRHFSKPGDFIALADAEIAVSNQWGIGNIGSFITHVNQMPDMDGLKIE